MKTPVQNRRFQVNKSTKMFLALPDQTQEVQRPYMAVAGLPGNKQTSPGLKKLAEAIKIEISPPEEENQDIEASNNNQVSVCLSLQ